MIEDKNPVKFLESENVIIILHFTPINIIN